MGKINVGLVVTVLAVLVALAALSLAKLYACRPRCGAGLKDVLWGMQAGVTALAVILGGIFAAYKWQVFRESEPHLTMHPRRLLPMPVGDSYIHSLAVTAVLHNSSRVQIELREGFFLLQQVASALDEDVEALYAQVLLPTKSPKTFNGITLDKDKRRINWGEGELVVEHG